MFTDGPNTNIRRSLSVGENSISQGRWSQKSSDRDVREVTHHPLPVDPPMFNVGSAAKSDYPRKKTFSIYFSSLDNVSVNLSHFTPKDLRDYAAYGVFTIKSGMLKSKLKVGINSWNEKWCNEALERRCVLT